MGVSRDLHRVVVETDVARALNSCVQNQNRHQPPSLIHALGF